MPQVAALIRSFRPGIVVVMTSGRAEGDWPGDRRRRRVMLDWIHKHDLPIDHLFMRTGGDARADAVVKQEILDTQIRPRFDVLLAIDDGLTVVDMWRANGIPVIVVTDPELPPTLLARSC